MNTTYPGLEYTRPSLEYTTKASSIQQKPREFILFPRAGHVLASLFWLTRQRFTCLRQSRPAPPRYISGPIHRYTPHTVCGLHIAKSARLILAV